MRHRDWEDAQDGLMLTADQMNGRMAQYADKPIFRWNKQGRWIDLSAQMALDALCLSRMASMLGRNAEERAFLSEHAELKEKINEHLWSEGHAFYLDSGYGRLIDRMHIGGLWTLIAEVVPPDRPERLITSGSPAVV